jgi:hypothetical protein
MLSDAFQLGFMESRTGRKVRILVLVSTHVGEGKWGRVGMRLAFRLERRDLAVARAGSVLC